MRTRAGRRTIFVLDATTPWTFGVGELDGALVSEVTYCPSGRQIKQGFLAWMLNTPRKVRDGKDPIRMWAVAPTREKALRLLTERLATLKGVEAAEAEIAYQSRAAEEQEAAAALGDLVL